MTRLPKPRYTGVPDVLFDVLLPQLEDSELRVILVIIRKTLGWRQDEEDLSLTTIARLSGVSKSSVVRATTSLIDRGLIERKRNFGVEAVGQVESTYRVLLYDDNSGTPEPPTAQGGEPPMTQAPEPPVAQVIGRVLNTNLQTQDTIPTLSSEDPDSPGTAITFAEFLQIWNRTPRLKKPNKAIRTRAEENWNRGGVEITESKLEAALSGFSHSTFAKENGYPMLAFVKNPISWVQHDGAEFHDGASTRSRRAPGSIAAPVEVPPGVSTPPSAPGRDFLAEWNTKVPNGKTEYDGGRAAVASLRIAELDPDFDARFDEVCEVATKIRERDKAATWLDFYWILKMKDGSLKPGWKRLLTDLRGMSIENDRDKPKKSKSQIAIEEAMADSRRRIAEAKKTQ